MTGLASMAELAELEGGEAERSQVRTLTARLHKAKH